MKKLFIVVALSIILIYLNQGYSYPILEETPEEIIMQNSWIAVKISKETGVISSLIYWFSERPIELLADRAFITIRDIKESIEYKQYEGILDNYSVKEFPPDSVKAIFNINFTPLPEESYSIQVTYTLYVQALHWDAMLQTSFASDREANIDFTFPEIADMEYAFWTKDDAPFKLPMLHTIRYREVFQRVRSPLVIPCLILYDTISNAGLSFISPFEVKKPGLQFQLDTIPQEYVNSKLTISNYYLRLGNNHPAHTALYIVPHEADWRPGFAWLYDKYPDYFNPETTLQGEGWHAIVDERPDYTELKELRERGVEWVEFIAHNPFFGIYAPPDRDSWIIIDETNDNMSYHDWETAYAFNNYRHTDYDSNQARIDSLHNYDIQTYMYFQSFESWKQYADEVFPGEFARGANGETIPAWRQCYLMNPDPNGAWGKHIDSQITVVLDSYPNIAGILYDRDDYCDYDYNPLHNDDGVTMIGPDSVYMLGFALEKINYSVLKAVHEHDTGTVGKGVWTNGPTSIEVCKGMDGIMSENLFQAPYFQYLGINRPLILLPSDLTPQQTEEKLKTALWTGHFPSVAYWGCDTKCLGIDSDYRPLFSFYKGKKWVLYPHALQLPAGIKGNIFRTPIPEEVAFPDTDYLVAMIDPERYTYILYPDSARDIFQYDRWAKVRVPDSMDIKYCYIQSGDYKGVNQDSIYKDNGIEINVPAHRVSSLIQLSKEPRYEVTRTSSPVLTRGDSGKFEVKIQNIKGEGPTYYDILLKTPFDSISDTFTLQLDSIKKVGLNFLVPNGFPLGETTMKVILRSPRKDTVVFTSWVVDILTFQLPEKLFVHFIAGDTFPFILVNNTKRTLNLTLEGEFVSDSGEINFPFLTSQGVDLDSLEAKDLLVFIKPDEEVDTVKILAIVSIENDTVDTVYAIRPVERSMDTILALFYDDFSSGTMDKWDTIHGNWDASSGVAKGDTDWHFARENNPIPGIWDNYKFQVNTKIDGSYNPLIDWLKSYIFFRVKIEENGDTNYYRFGFHGFADGYDILNLYKRKGNSWTCLEKYEFKPKKNVWYNLKIEVKNDSINCFLDGNQVISVRDSIAPFLYGDIGIGVLEDGMVTYYDDVVVRELQR